MVPRKIWGALGTAASVKAMPVLLGGVRIGFSCVRKAMRAFARPTQQRVVIEYVEILGGNFSAEVEAWQQASALTDGKLIHSRNSSSPWPGKNGDMVADDKRSAIDVTTNSNNQPEHGKGTRKEAESRKTGVSQQKAENGRNIGKDFREHTLATESIRGRNPQHQGAKHP